MIIIIPRLTHLSQMDPPTLISMMRCSFGNSMVKEMFILEMGHISQLIYSAVKKKNSKFICILFIHQEVMVRFNFKLKFYFKSE